MAGTVPVWTVQATAAHAAATTMGAYRASPQHLENDDFCNPEAYEFMVTELEKRVGPCPTEVQESWIERGGAGTAKPVWVWLQPPYVPVAARCGQRNILVEAEVQREDVLGSQIAAYDHVLNDFPLAISEAEDEEFDALKKSAPEIWRQRKIASWQRIFEVDWQGDTYSLARGDEATLQGVLWQLPLSCARRTRRMLELGRTVGTEAVEVDYPADGVSVGEDVEMTAAWISRRSTLPPLHLRLHVVAVVDGGRAATAGVRKGWTVTCLLSPVEDEEPLPSLPLQRGVGSGRGVRPKRAPPPAAELRAALRQLRGVQLVFQAPEEEPDSGDELYDEAQEIPESSSSESDSDAAT